MDVSIAQVRIGEHLIDIQLPDDLTAEDIGSIKVTTKSTDADGDTLNETDQTILPDQTAVIAGFADAGPSEGFSLVDLLIQLFGSDDGSGEPVGEVSAQVDAADVHEDSGHAHHTITDNNAFLMAMGEGSRIEIHAADAEKESWTQLAENTATGSNKIKVADDTGWEVGDKIAIAWSAARSMRDDVQNEFTIEAISEDGTEITLDSAFRGYFGGKRSGEVETHTSGDNTWELDMRAEVALLSRNVKIQGDADSAEDGYGGHTMVMHGGDQHISGAEFFRMGQLDELGRYPVHWHMNDDVAGQYVENSSVHHSFNKGMTIHGSHNARLEDNVIFDHVGHGVFLEDGSEYGSQIIDNVVFGTRASKSGEPIPTDKSNVSSYWIENGNTVLVGNHAAGQFGGEKGIGFWITPANNGPHGASEDVYTDPDEQETWGGSLDNMVFRDNLAHTYHHGMFVEKVINKDTLTVGGGKAGPGELLAEGYTAYANDHGAWVGSRVFFDNATVGGNNIQFFFHNDSSVVNDSLLTGANANPVDNNGGSGIFLYRNADSGVYDSHFVNFDNAADTANAFAVRTGVQQTPTWTSGLTFDNVDLRVNQAERDTLDSPHNSDNRIIDLDGSLTGEAGTFVTRQYLSEQFGGFEATEDAKFEDSYLSSNSHLFSTSFNHQFASSQQFDGAVEAMITRDDGAVYEREVFDSHGSNYGTFQTAGRYDGEAAYLVEFDGFPSYFNVKTEGMLEGTAVVYQLPNVASARLHSLSVETNVVDSLEEMFASDTTAAHLDGQNLFIRIVSEPIENSDPDADSIDAMVDNVDSPAQAFLAGSNGYVRFGGIKHVAPEDRILQGEAELDADMLALLEQQDGPGKDYDVPELIVPDGMSSPTYFGRDIEMTEDQALANVDDTEAAAIFDIDYDNETNTVSIEGTFSNLASDVTMMHLHAGGPGQGGGVIGGLKIETADGKNGSFSGEFSVTDAQEAALIAGNTYVNLHTVDVPGGALRGQVEIEAARNFNVETHESTSDTTEIADDMMRWSDADTWEGGVPDADSHVVIHKGMSVVLDQSITVKSILVAGGELIVEDARDLELASDWVLVTDGGLFQVGTEDTPFEHDFTLTLEGDDKDNDVDIMAHMQGNVANTVHAGMMAMPGDDGHDGHDDPADPEDPVDPVAPVTPAPPTNPTVPAPPTVPAKPADPVDPAKPADPADPADPAKPADPADPAKPADPADPTDPDELTEVTQDEDEDQNIFERFFDWLMSLFGGSDDGDEDAAEDDVPVETFAEQADLSALIPTFTIEEGEMNQTNDDDDDETEDPVLF